MDNLIITKILPLCVIGYFLYIFLLNLHVYYSIKEYRQEVIDTLSAYDSLKVSDLGKTLPNETVINIGVLRGRLSNITSSFILTKSKLLISGVSSVSLCVGYRFFIV